jgi:hypothetical protein
MAIRFCTRLLERIPLLRWCFGRRRRERLAWVKHIQRYYSGESRD